MNQKTKLYQSVVTGIGASLPKKIVTNKDLTKIVDTTEEWIVERTGIQERRIASDNETTSSLGTEAAKIALQDAQLKNTDIDLIILDWVFCYISSIKNNTLISVYNLY